ncbi:MAG: hypothetical protein HYR92_06875 [Burkholderiales bacterium]|nr:hypothetical protein [Burkholderiales bacterium]
MKLYTESKERELEELGVIQIQIRIRPKRLITIACVLLMHALLLFLMMRISADIKNGRPVSSPMVFVMEKLKLVKKGEPEPKKAAAKASKSKKIIALAQNPDGIVDRTQPPPPPEKIETPPMDMAEMIKAARERRQQVETQAAAENQAAQQGNRGMSPQERAEANVRRSMQQANGQDGTSGVFQIISKSVRMGTFSFRGWKVNSNGWKQTIEVDAGLGGNIDLAMVRKMIEIIRTHYKGDFRWESQRLGRVVNLSARVEDSGELEKFMLEEFPEFATPKR